MRRLLVVEDDENKRSQIDSFLRENFRTCEVRYAKSLRSGLLALDEGHFELIILDMTLPNFDQGIDEDGGVIHPLGGQEFLRKMKRRRIRIPVIVLTQFERFGIGSDRLDLPSLTDALATKYAAICATTIYYNSAVDAWKEQLRSEISKILGVNE